MDFNIFRAERPEAKARYWKSFIKTFLVWLVIGLLGLAAVKNSTREQASSTSLLVYGAAAFAVFIAYLACRKLLVRSSLRKAISSKPGAVLEGPVDIVMDDKGIECNGEGSRSMIEWRIVKRIEETPTHIFLMLSDIQALLIPKRDLSPELASEIARFSAQHLAARRG